MHPYHNHDHSLPALGALNRAFAIAIIINLVHTILEFGVAVWIDSVSLFADATHNLSDILALLLAWGAAYVTVQPRTQQFSYGYGKSSIFAALVNALLLVILAVFIGVEAFDRLFSPKEGLPHVVVIAALCGVLVNGGTAWLFLKESHHDLNVKAAFLHLAFDALLSFGVVAAGAVMIVADVLWPDPVMGLVIAAVIIAMTWRLLVDAFQLMLDAVPKNVNLESVEAYLNDLPGVASVHDLHVWALSTKEICLTAHLVMLEHTLVDEPDGYRRVSEELSAKLQVSHMTLQVERSLECKTQNCGPIYHAR